MRAVSFGEAILLILSLTGQYETACRFDRFLLLIFEPECYGFMRWKLCNNGLDESFAR